MTTEDRQSLTAEQTAITERLAKVEGEEKERLTRQYSQRLAQIADRLSTDPPPKKAKA